MTRERGPTRVAYLLVPELLAAARLRAEPELAGRPFAIASAAASSTANPQLSTRPVVLSVSPEAARCGVQVGASLSRARAVCGGLAVRVADPALERAARAALLDVALSASPRAMADESQSESSAVVLDASGLGRVFASEAALAGALVERAREQGLPAVAAVAATRALARVAARDAIRDGPGTTRLVAARDEARFLAPLSVDLLEPDDATADLLTRFGIYRLGTLLAMAPAAVATRLGGALADALDALRGSRREPPIPAPRTCRIEESLSLEAPLGEIEPFLFVFGGVLSRVFARLALRHLACRTLEIDLALDTAASESAGAGRHALRLSLAAPTTDTRVWLRRVRLALERDPPRAPVAVVSVATEGQPTRRDQLDLFRPAGPAPAALDALLAELELLCGDGRVGTPRIPDDHHPSAIAIAPFAPHASSKKQSAPVPPPTLALRAFRPPLPAQVQMRAGRPESLRSAIANGDVVRCAGPWRTTGGWWTEADRFAFDSYDVATSDGVLIRLHHDLLRDAWEIDAAYD
jgi:protein ImuB